MGRPTKIEGNPDHPASLGATDIFVQAAIARRSTTPTARRSSCTDGRDQHLGRLPGRAIAGARRPSGREKGAGLRILTETVTSPTLAAPDPGSSSKEFPEAKWHQYEPVGRDNARAGARLAFGERRRDPVYHFDKADVDPLARRRLPRLQGPASLRYARALRRRRREPRGGRRAAMNRLYVVEPTPTLTGAMADHRLPLRGAATIAHAARGVARAVKVEGAPATDPERLDGAGRLARGRWPPT